MEERGCAGYKSKCGDADTKLKGEQKMVIEEGEIGSKSFVEYKTVSGEKLHGNGDT